MAIKITSVLTGGPNDHQTSAAELNAVATDFFSPGFVSGLNVTAHTPNDSGIAVQAGIGHILATPQGQEPQLLRVRVTSAEDLTLASNATGQTRYDFIYLAVDAVKAATPNKPGDDVATLTVSRSTSNTVDNGQSNFPFKTLLAIVTVAPGFSALAQGTVVDKRNLAVAKAAPSGMKYLRQRGLPTAPAHSATAIGQTVSYNGFPEDHLLTDLVIGRVYEIKHVEPNLFMSGASSPNNQNFTYVVNGANAGTHTVVHTANGLGQTSTASAFFTATAQNMTLKVLFSTPNAFGTFTQLAAAGNPATLMVTEA